MLPDLAALGARIDGLGLPEMRNYGDRATGAHNDDTGLIAAFRKT